MRTLVGVVAWLATRAGTEVDRPGGINRGQLATKTTADKAGRLVAVPEEAREQVTAPSLVSYWALGVAAALIFLILAVGYVRRWRKAPLGARGPFVWTRSSRRK